MNKIKEKYFLNIVLHLKNMAKNTYDKFNKKLINFKYNF